MISEQVVRGLKKAPKSSHMVLFYNSQKEKHQVIFPFVEHGLEKGQAIIYLSDEESPRQVIKEMSAFDVDVHKHEKSGALKILNGEEWYVEKRTINKELVVKKWMKASADATRNGFCGLIVSGEPTYFLRHNILDPWMEYERSLPRRFDFPLTAVCRYRTRDLASHNMSCLLELVRIHSHTITSTSFQEVDFRNFFLHSVDDTFKRVLGESGTHAVFHFLENKHELPKSSIGDKVDLFNEALDNLFGSGRKFLQGQVLKTVCSKLGITYDLKNKRVKVK